MLIGNRLSAADKRRLAMLYANNQGGNLRQQLLDGAPFLAELTHTAVPQRAATGTTATFTRATTKTIPDHEGVLRTLIAGELGFPGARREYNLWGTASSTLANGANNSMTLPAGAYQFSMGAGTGTATFSGTGGATGTLAASASGRAFVAKTITAGTLVVTASVADLVDLQVVSMVGCSDQTTIREYVPIGVESAPYYHGSFVDGVKCFNTDIAGNAIPSTTLLGYQAEGARTNLCLQSNAFTTTWTDSGAAPVQNVTGPDGATSAWTLTDNSAVVSEQINQSITLTAATHTFSVFVKKTAGAQAAYPALSVYNAGVAQTAACTIDTTNGVATVWTAYTGLAIATSSARCSSYNDDFWRVELTFLSTAAAWSIFLNPAVTTNATQSTGTFDATAQGSAVFYGAQLELGSFASSYIATTTAAVTRNADVLTYPSAGNISGTVGWVYTEVMSQWSDTATGRIAIGVSAATNSPMTFYGLAPTVVGYFDGANASAKTGLSSIATGVRKRASTWGGSTVLVGGDGVVPASGTFDGDFNIGASFAVGSTTTGAENFFGTIKNLYIGQRKLSASEMQAITS